MDSTGREEALCKGGQVGLIDDVDQHFGISSLSRPNSEHTVHHTTMPHARRKRMIGKNDLQICIVATQLVLYQHLVEGLDI
jgi:hypothetical protein